MKTCPDCGERVYSLGCVNCNEAAYIERQVQENEREKREKRMIPNQERRCPLCHSVFVEEIEPRMVPQLTTDGPRPPVRVVQQCPECRVLFGEGELRRWWAAMEAE